MLPPYIDLAHLRSLLQLAKQEDLGTVGDISSLATIPASATGEAFAVAKEPGVVAGLALVPELLALYDPALECHFSAADGQWVDRGDRLITLSGSVRSILAVERPLLNLLQRLSGIATKTQHMVDQLHGSRTQLLDTRKTTPGWRSLEKWAVSLGGAKNHRLGLYDRVMLKENHLQAAGGIGPALASVRQFQSSLPQPVEVEVEVESLEQLAELLHHGDVDHVLLDNMDNDTLAKAVALVDGRLKTEASGNVNAERLPSMARLGLDYISMGALTHSAKALDISLYLS